MVYSPDSTCLLLHNLTLLLDLYILHHLHSLGRTITPPAAIIGTIRVNNNIATIVHLEGTHFVAGWMGGPYLAVPMAGEGKRLPAVEVILHQLA